jgi:predicted dehydrogenase
MTRVLMVGAGGVAQRHVSVLTALGARVVAVVDPATEAASALAVGCGATAYEDLDQALEESRPDAAYVCVPPFAHGPAELAVLGRGLPLFVEKPVALDVATAEEVAARVAAAGVVTATGYHWRCLDVLDRVRVLLDRAPPLAASGYWLDKRPPVPWWAHRDRSGGQVVEQLTHVVDLARLLLGDATEVYAAGARDPSGSGDGDVDDVTVATVRFASGAVATFSATSLLRAKHRAALHTISRGLVLELSEAGLVVDDGDSRRTFEPADDPRVAVDREFLEAVRGERGGTRTAYAEAVASHRLACAIAESARTGRAVAPDSLGTAVAR